MSEIVNENVIATDVVVYSVYLAAKKVNKMLKADGIDKVLPEQMFYNYTTAKLRQGKKPLIVCAINDEGRTFITEENLLSWYEKYSKKAKLLATLND